MSIKSENHLESEDTHGTFPAEPPLFLRQLSPEMLQLLERHFWCDFSDIIPAMSWDNISKTNQ